MFIENLAVMPMLDGKLIIININDTENAKVVYISSEPAFNNVIYLSRMGNTMVAATPKRLITLGNTGKLEYKTNISEVAIDGKKIYLFTKEGKILALNSQLELLATSKFKFAHYAAATAFGGRVYALDQQGSLIVLNSTLTKSKVYNVGAVDEPAFMTGTKLYKDGKVIELSKLGYE
jgi:outer membrane protein assembly factor BamB